ncbi:hypothetical protein JCM33374_g5462 [Metschnikowia sp. JCM 33374]|nr:hypothetical protein JCM33374_g5462 [Metschnikowia sp. JCM 33374]
MKRTSLLSPSPDFGELLDERTRPMADLVAPPDSAVSSEVVFNPTMVDFVDQVLLLDKVDSSVWASVPCVAKMFLLQLSLHHCKNIIYADLSHVSDVVSWLHFPHISEQMCVIQETYLLMCLFLDTIVQYCSN